MRRRLDSMVAVVVLAAAGLVATSGPSGAVTPTLTPSATSVAVGGNVTVMASQCSSDESQSGNDFTYRRADIVLITGTAANERLSAVQDGGGDGASVTVPGWVDPAHPAVLAGRCTETSFDPQNGHHTDAVLFTYADVPIDITPAGPSPSTPVLALSRTTAAGGQVIVASGSGCAGADFAEVVLFRGGDLSGRSPFDFVAAGRQEEDGPAADGTFTTELALNTESPDQDGGGFSTSGGPLAEGDYVVFAYCFTENETTSASVISMPQLVHVVVPGPAPPPPRPEAEWRSTSRPTATAARTEAT